MLVWVLVIGVLDLGFVGLFWFKLFSLLLL